MKRNLTVYLKLFLGLLLLSIPVVLIFGAVIFLVSPTFSIWLGDAPDPAYAVSNSTIFTFFGILLLFDILMMVILGTAHIVAVNKSPYSTVDGAMNVRHNRSITRRQPIDETFDLCVTSLSSIEGMTITTKDQNLGVIAANAAMSPKSWGDSITIKLQKVTDSETAIALSSRPRGSIIVVDYGKNLELIERISHLLAE